MSKQQWYSNWENVEVCFQLNFIFNKFSLQTFNMYMMYMPDSCRTQSNQLHGNCGLQQKTGKIHFGCSQACCKEVKLVFERGKKAEKVREVFVAVDVLVSCTCFACCLKQMLPKTNRSFTVLILMSVSCRVFLLSDATRDTKQQGHLQSQKTNAKPITNVMAARHLVSLSRLDRPESLATD